MQLLKVRSQLAHDYDGEIALKYFEEITRAFGRKENSWVEQ